jgi:hypothetical protein
MGCLGFRKEITEQGRKGYKIEEKNYATNIKFLYLLTQNPLDKAQVWVGRPMPLSLAYDIVTKGHGGTIACESVESEGTTFVVRLPNFINSIFT